MEVEGEEHAQHLVTACNNTCEEGMVIHTNTTRVREARRTNLELLLSQHRINCPACERNGTCELQKVVSTMPIGDTMNYKHEYPEDNWDTTLPIIRDEQVHPLLPLRLLLRQGPVPGYLGHGGHRRPHLCQRLPSPQDGGGGLRLLRPVHHPLSHQRPAHPGRYQGHHRGQRRAERSQTRWWWSRWPPAVRAAWGETFGLSPEVATEKRMAAALRRIGFDYVFDTNFSADLTIMEEGTEFLERLQHTRRSTSGPCSPPAARAGSGS